MILLTSCKHEYHKVIENYSNGNVREENIYYSKTDTDNYRWLIYYKNKNKQSECEIRNNKFIGKKITYWENGNIKQIENLVEPSILNYCCPDAFVERFDSSGRKTEDFHNKNGVENGIVQVYHTNGKPRDVYEMKDGIINGKRWIYDTNGILNNTSTFINGNPTGIVCFYNENGDTVMYYTNSKNGIIMPAKKWLRNDRIIVGDYLDSSESQILWLWLDKSGEEIKRTITSTRRFPE